ncbi:hypothetical protein GCM10020000_01780 [Streptomyces olivoverticillatus]
MAPARPRLLVLRALGLGDLLAAVPALRALRRAFPEHEIVLAAPPELAAPVTACGAVDTLLPAAAPGRAVPQTLPWSGPPPDIAVDLHGNGPPSHRLLIAVRPRRLLAFAHPGTPTVHGPEWKADEHERERWCRLLRAYGIPADPGDFALAPPRTPSPAPGAVVLHPGAGAPARCWPPERYAAVARALVGRGERVVVTGGPGEDALVTRAAVPGTERLTGGLPFGTLAALVARAHTVISGDTGLAHLAVAFGTPPRSPCSGPSRPLCGARRPRRATRRSGTPDRPAIRTPGTPTPCCCGSGPRRCSRRSHHTAAPAEKQRMGSGRGAAPGRRLQHERALSRTGPPQRPPGMKGGTGVPPTETPPGEGFLSGTGPQETYNPTRGWAKGPLFVIGIMVVGMVVLFIIWAAIV